MAKAVLANDGIFDEEDYSFILTNKALGKPQKYYFITQEDKHTNLDNSLILRLTHPLGEYALKVAKKAHIPTEEIVFDLSGQHKKKTYLEKLRDEGCSGWCKCDLMTVNSFETEEYLILSGIDNNLQPVSSETLDEIIKLEAISDFPTPNIDGDEKEILDKLETQHIEDTKQLSESRNMSFFKEESDKIDRYAEDKLYTVEKELSDVKAKIKTLSREERNADTIERKTLLQEEISSLERKKRRLRQNIFDAEDEIEEERKKLLSALQKRLKSNITIEHLFTFKWKLQ